VVRQEEDTDFDGEPETVSEFTNGTLRSLRQDSNGKGCFDVEERYDAKGLLVRQNLDENGDCRIDLWSRLQGERVIWQARDERGTGKPTVLVKFDASGKPEIQEQISEGSSRPDVKVFFDDAGDIRSQCVDNDGNGRFDVRYRFSGGQVRTGLVDGDGDGRGETRQVFENGQAVRSEVDTNGDGRADVAQYLEGGQMVRQCEDADYDGRVDRCFEGQSLVDVTGVTDLSEPLGELGCGGFDAFWRS